MPGMSAEDHLKIARRLHFQGDREEAIKEYERVLELDPDNEDAMSGLRSARAKDDDLSSGAPRSEPAGEAGLKRNFFANQAKSGSGEQNKVKNLLMSLFMLVLFGGCAYGAFIVGTFYWNYDSMAARENVDVRFERARVKEGKAQVNIEVVNKNPYLVRNMLVQYQIRDRGDNLIKEGTLTLNNSVPAGDRRTFPDVVLGEVNGEPGKLTARVDTLQIGTKKYKLKEKYAAKFMEAAAMRDKDALYEYEELTQDLEDFVPAFVGYGRALAARGKFDEALKQYSKALELDQDCANAHYYSAVALFYKGDKTAAKKEIDLAANLAPDDPEILWNQKYLFTMKDSPKNEKASSKEVQKRK